MLGVLHFTQNTGIGAQTEQQMGLQALQVCYKVQSVVAFRCFHLTIAPQVVKTTHAGAQALMLMPCCVPDVLLQEMNDHEQRCRFLQVWMTPDRKGHTPQYGSSSYEPSERHNQLLHVLSGVGPTPSWQSINSRGTIQLHADANVFVSENGGGVKYQLQLGPSRQAYLVCMEGKCSGRESE
jgi:hypothetical protein